MSLPVGSLRPVPCPVGGTDTDLLPPVLVVGMNRSGTKWLSNILCNHPLLVGAQSTTHRGIIETNMPNKLGPALGDLSDPDQFVAAVELWSQSDFFRAIEGRREFLYEADPRPRTCLEMFRCSMDDFRDRRAARGWIQKVDPWHAEDVIRSLGECRVVVIRREFESTLRSTVKLLRKLAWPASVTRLAASYGFQHAMLDRLCRQHGALVVAYESLRADPRAEVGRVCEFVGVPFHRQMLEVAYQPNTSFARDSDRERVLGRCQLAWACAVRAIAGLIPCRLAVALRPLVRRQGLQFVRGTFSERCREVGLEHLVD